MFDKLQAELLQPLGFRLRAIVAFEVAAGFQELLGHGVAHSAKANPTKAMHFIGLRHLCAPCLD